MPESTQLAVDVGVLKTQMKAVNDALEDLKRTNKEQTDTLTKIQSQLSEAKGGWRVMLLIGGSFATVAGLLAAWAGFFSGKH